MRKQIKRMLPKRVTSALRDLKYRRDLRAEFRDDRDRYARHCLPGEVSGALNVNPRNLEAQLTKDYHRIEKGLALPAPKRPFGAAVSSRIEGNIVAGRQVGTADTVVTFAESAHGALDLWNTEGVIVGEIAPTAPGGERGIHDVDAFFRTRHSVRDFDSINVSDEVLQRAVSLALQSPSVCNRQAWLVRFFRGDDVPRVLAFQNGNRGFTDVVPVVGLVTVDTRLFTSLGERNQAWIEGGIFSMSLVWALHALGADSCMLNMSVRNAKTDKLREQLGVGDHEVVVMMIAIGYAREGHRVARSPRRQVDDVVLPTSTEARGVTG